MKRHLLTLISLIFFAACHPSSQKPDVGFHQNSTYLFAVFGDSRDGNDVYSSLLSDATILKNPIAVLHLGDFISTPDKPSQYLVVKAINEHVLSKQISFLPVPGNHDIDDYESQQRFLSAFYQVPSTVYYSLEIDACYCIFLNSEDLAVDGGLGEIQMSWLTAQLEIASQKDDMFIAIMIHHPLFPQNHHKDEPIPRRDELHELFVKFGVNLVLSGHEHSYSHIEQDGVHYIVSGGAGSSLYNKAGPSSAFFHYLRLEKVREVNRLYLSAIGLTGIRYDAFYLDY